MLMHRQTQPVAFPSYPLKKIPRSLAKLQQAFHYRFAESILSKNFPQLIQNTFIKVAHLKPEFQLDEVTTVTGQDLTQSSSNNICILPIHLEPCSQTLLIQIELSLAHKFIGNILKIPHHIITNTSKLSEIEKGILLYFTLELIDNLKQAATNKESASFWKVSTIYDNFSRSNKCIQKNEVYHHLKFSLYVEKEAYSVHIFTPDKIEQPGTNMPLSQTSTPWLEKLLPKIKTISTIVRINIGYININIQELELLQIGDVVLFDQSDATMKIGLGCRGTIHGIFRSLTNKAEFVVSRLEPDLSATTRSKVHIPEIFGEDDMPTNPNLEPAEPGSDSDFEIIENDENLSSHWLGDLPVQLTVEIARTNITAEQILMMKPGHVIELQRKPNDPINLTTDGKVIATGELVEIEDSLGVRILSIAEDK